MSRYEWVPTPNWEDSRWTLKLDGVDTRHRVLRLQTRSGRWEAVFHADERASRSLGFYITPREAAQRIERAVSK